MRIARRIALFFTALLVVFGTVSTTTSTAFAAGFGPAPVASQSAAPNFHMTWDGGLQDAPGTWKEFPGTQSLVYSPTATDPWNMYSCYPGDCDGLVADTTGVHLLSIEKGYGYIATNHYIMWGSYSYSYTAANGDILSYYGSWNGRQTLPWTTQYYSADTGQWLTLTLSYASLDLNWLDPEVAQMPVCDTQTENNLPFCSGSME